MHLEVIDDAGKLLHLTICTTTMHYCVLYLPFGQIRHTDLVSVSLRLRDPVLFRVISRQDCNYGGTKLPI
jgi:hypothetical protein